MFMAASLEEVMVKTAEAGIFSALISLALNHKTEANTAGSSTPHTV